MSDDRAFAWTHLLPPGVAYQPVGGPEWWQEALRARSNPGGQPVPVLWGNAWPAGFDLTAVVGAVAVNPPAEVARALRSAGFRRLHRFAVLPGLRDARWFVPLNSQRIAAAAFQLYTPYRLPARAKLRAVRLAARLGIPGWQRDVIAVACRAPSPVEELLGSVASEHVAAMAVSTGTPGPARKMTLAGFDATGRMLAVAKVAISPLASRLLAQEASCLRALTQREDLAAHCPRLLAEAEVAGERIIVQEAVPGRPSGTALTPAHARLLAALASGPARPATSSTLITKLLVRLAALGEPGIPARHVQDWAIKELEGAMLPRTIVHGDFAPWNLRLKHGQIVAFDWEYAHCDGLPLLDETHHRLQTGFLLHGWGASRALAELARLEALGIYEMGPEHVRALQAIYLLDAFARRHEEGYPRDDRLLRSYAEMLERLAARLEASAA